MTLSSLSLSLSLEEIKSIVVGTTSLGLATGKTSSSSSLAASSSPEELISDATVASSSPEELISDAAVASSTV